MTRPDGPEAVELALFVQDALAVLVQDGDYDDAILHEWSVTA